MLKKERANQHCADRPFKSGNRLTAKPDARIVPQDRVFPAGINPNISRSSSLTVIVTNARERETIALRRWVEPHQAAREEVKVMGRNSDGTAPVGILSETNGLHCAGVSLGSSTHRSALTNRGFRV